MITNYYLDLYVSSCATDTLTMIQTQPRADERLWLGVRNNSTTLQNLFHRSGPDDSDAGT